MTLSRELVAREEVQRLEEREQAVWAPLMLCPEAQRVLCLGRPRPAVLKAMAATGREIVVDDGRIDLVVLASARAARRLGRDRALQDEMGRLLGPRGLVYFEIGPRLDQMLSQRALDRLSERFGPPLLLRLSPTWPPAIRAIVPWGEQAVVEEMFDRGIREAWLDGRRPWRRRTATRPPVVLARAGRRCGVLLGPAAAALAAGPPDYVVRIARSAGIDLSGHRWACVVPRSGGIELPRLLLFSAEEAALCYVVRVAMTEGQRQRLESRQCADQPRFAGSENAVAVAGWEAAVGQAPRA